jgi:molybdenum cofactor guanylyltransferase
VTTKPRVGDFARIAPAWSLGVLVGGRSSRMGRDKATAPFLGGTLLGRVVERLAPPGIPVLAAAAKDGPELRPGVRRVDDPVEGGGPLFGAAALLAAAETKFVLIVPCDMPFLPRDLGDRMLRLVQGTDAALFVVDGRVEPFPAFVATDLAPVFADLLNRGLRRADAWRECVAAAYAPFQDQYPKVDPARAFFNANDPASLAKAEAIARAADGDA